MHNRGNQGYSIYGQKMTGNIYKNRPNINNNFIPRPNPYQNQNNPQNNTIPILLIIVLCINVKIIAIIYLYFPIPYSNLKIILKKRRKNYYLIRYSPSPFYSIKDIIMENSFLN